MQIKSPKKLIEGKKVHFFDTGTIAVETEDFETHYFDQTPCIFLPFKENMRKIERRNVQFIDFFVAECLVRALILGVFGKFPCILTSFKMNYLNSFKLT